MMPILFEDNDIVAVDKPAGLASIPGPMGEENLLSLLSAIFSEKLYVVHRLDKEVSGAILFARHAAAHRYLNEQFSRRSVKKTYAALTHGVIEENNGVIDQPIRQFGSGRMGVDPQRGKPSITNFRVTSRWAAYTQIEVYPITGRRHQIRVHFYTLGYPLVGDLRYGERAVQGQFPRLMLHAQQIRCRLPSGQEVTIEAPLPASFQAVVGMIRQGAFPAR